MKPPSKSNTAAFTTPLFRATQQTFKCFDQLERPLVYHLAAVAGIPPILKTYIRYQENLTIYNTHALGLGTPHAHLNGIPQGCLLSMTLVDLLMRPWMLLMKSMNAVARTLADDLLLFVTGTNHTDTTIQATDTAHTYLRTMGARVATSKNLLFASCKNAKDKLASHVWDY